LLVLLEEINDCDEVEYEREKSWEWKWKWKWEKGFRVRYE